MNGNGFGRRNVHDLNEALFRYLPGATEEKKSTKISVSTASEPGRYSNR
jgi:hypothetical protein